MRTERDFLGDVELPESSLIGVNTRRAVDNFGFSGRRLGEAPALVRGMAVVKGAAARANAAAGTIDATVGRAIASAAAEMRAGTLDDHLLVDMMEGSGGTSLNMNVNEVLANRALQLLGCAPGDHATVHPNDHVNRSQSTNDVVPSAIKIGCVLALEPLATELDLLAESFAGQARRHADVVKLGRTCLQDAQPMTLGQMFGGHAALTRRLAERLRAARHRLFELPLGATAVGTGFGAPPGWRERVFPELDALTGLRWRPAPDLFDALANADEFARLSAELRAAGTSLAKIANDLQILSSGPTGGLGELRLPAAQAGSSIMPGKVNPVIPMAICQIGFAVSGYDAIVAQACQQGQLEINPYEPVIALHLFASIGLLTRGAARFRTHCVDGIEPDLARIDQNLAGSSAVATALLPALGYERVTGLVREAQALGVAFGTHVVSLGVLARAELDAMLAISAGDRR